MSMTKQERMSIVAGIERLVNDPNADQFELEALRCKLGAELGTKSENGKGKNLSEIKEAKRLLETTNLSIEEVLRATGANEGTIRTYISKKKIVRM